MIKIRVVTITVKYRFKRNEPLHSTCVLLLFGDRLKDGYKYEKAKVKKVKRTIPAWASVTASKKVPVTNFAGTQHKVDNILIEAITVCTDVIHLSTQSVACVCVSVSFKRYLCDFSSTVFAVL